MNKSNNLYRFFAIIIALSMAISACSLSQFGWPRTNWEVQATQQSAVNTAVASTVQAQAGPALVDTNGWHLVQYSIFPTSMTYQSNAYAGSCWPTNLVNLNAYQKADWNFGTCKWDVSPVMIYTVTPAAPNTPLPMATNTAQAATTSCEGVSVVSGAEFDLVKNHDFGDTFNWWLIFAWDGSNTNTWVGAIGEPMASLDLERATIVGAQYLVTAKNRDGVACLAHLIATKKGIAPYWLYVGKNDLNLPEGFSTEFPGDGWKMDVRMYQQEPIADGNKWANGGNTVQFSPKTVERTFGSRTDWSYAQTWNTKIGTKKVFHVLAAPGYQITFDSKYQGGVFSTQITNSLKLYFERTLQMVAEVVYRDEGPTVFTSYCGPENGDRPNSWDDALPDGVTCEVMP